jgi:hypothetical protein
MSKRKLDSDQRPRFVHEVDGLCYAIAGELLPRQPTALDRADNSPLANAIRDAFPNSDSIYWAMIARRYLELYKGLTQEEATLAVSKGYSSPSAAMRAKVIPTRKYIGFRKDHGS